MTPPEQEGVGFLAILSSPQPFSPSPFLDLPQTPHKDQDGGLDFVSRILMEDEIDGKFFCQHPSLLQAQLRQYAQALLSDELDGSNNPTLSSSPSYSDYRTNNTTTSPHDDPIVGVQEAGALRRWWPTVVLRRGRSEQRHCGHLHLEWSGCR